MGFGWEKGKEKVEATRKGTKRGKGPEEERERERERERGRERERERGRDGETERGRRKKVIEEEREAPQRKQGNVQCVRGAVMCAKCNVWRDKVHHLPCSIKSWE